MKAIDVKAEDKRLARSDGFKKKAPKKPKQSASMNSMENYISRYNDWAKELKERAKAGKKRDDLKKEVRGAKR